MSYADRPNRGSARGLRALAAAQQERHAAGECEQASTGPTAAGADVRDAADLVDLLRDLVGGLVGVAAVALAIDVHVRFDGDVDVDVHLIGELVGALLQIRGVQELAVAEDRAALVLALGLALLDRLRLAVGVDLVLAIDLTLHVGLRRARTAARVGAGLLALDAGVGGLRVVVLALGLAARAAVVRAAGATRALVVLA